MAVVTLYMSDRDKSKTFTEKKEAENYDKMLELAENVSIWMKSQIEGLSDEQVDGIGKLVAQNKDLLSKALKGKSSILIEGIQSPQESESKGDDEEPDNSLDSNE